MKLLTATVALKFVDPDHLGKLCRLAVLDILKETNDGRYGNMKLASDVCVGTVIA